MAVQIDAMLAHPEAGLSSTDFEIIDEYEERISGGYVGFCESYAELLRGNGIAASTVMVRRDVFSQIGSLNERYRQADDWDMWLRIAQHYPVFRIRETLVGYRLHSGNRANYADPLRRSWILGDMSARPERWPSAGRLVRARREEAAPAASWRTSL